MQDMPQSQNTWTQAGDELAAQQAANDATRQQKMDEMNQQYDQAVDRNREIQGLPPVNNPNGSGLPPLPPV
jgi:ribosome-binding protein aMBF1 (putative translation factor)